MQDQPMSAPDSASPQRSFSLRQLLLVLSTCAVSLAVLRSCQVSAERSRVSRAKARTVFELNQFEFAIRNYEIHYREPPPPPIKEDMRAHVARVFPSPRGQAEREKFNQRDLDELDERETLVFWLGGSIHSPFTSSKTFFDFEEDRLADTDKDGWLEYVDYHGNIFRYVDGEPIVHFAETGENLSTKSFD